MANYYSEKLSGEHLSACYDLAPPRTKAYLDAETEFVLQKTSSSMAVLELGCGYGRVLRRLVSRVRRLVGIDTSIRSLRMASEFVSRSEFLDADSQIEAVTLKAHLRCVHSNQVHFREGSHVSASAL